MPLKLLLRKFHLTKKLFLLFFFSVFIAVISIIVSHILVIKKITVVSSDKNIKIIGLTNFYNKNLLFFNTQKASEILLRLNPLIKEINLEKKYPNQLKIEIKFGQPAAYLPSDLGYFLISENGTVLAKSKEKIYNLPEIFYYQKFNHSAFQPGDKIDYKDIILALYFLKKAKEIALNIISIDIKGFYMIGLNLENRKILFSAEKDWSIQENQFVSLIKRFKLEGSDFRVMDLRFDKPVIEFN
ncbi:MAG: FtsQ-type POTRA domain-containing protein [Microgenomates group bacterium]|nr:FtsQ-type POTRA domain-containing protein [Microgenomates group bacterium]